MKNSIIILISVLVLFGCAATGSRQSPYAWADKRNAELKESLEKGEITKAEYYQLTNEVQQTINTFRSKPSSFVYTYDLNK